MIDTNRILAWWDRHPLLFFITLVSLFAAVLGFSHSLGMWGWYAGHLNGGIWIGPGRYSVGFEFYGHPGFFRGEG